MTVKKILAQRRMAVATDVADRRAASAVTARMLRSKLQMHLSLPHVLRTHGSMSCVLNTAHVKVLRV